MNKIEKLSARVVLGKTENIRIILDRMSDNIHDLNVYLQNTMQNLEGEIDNAEALNLVEGLIKQYNEACDQVKVTQPWIEGLAE
jgi:cob(I)alamin adenosyltransferase